MWVNCFIDRHENCGEVRQVLNVDINLNDFKSPPSACFEEQLHSTTINAGKLNAADDPGGGTAEEAVAAVAETTAAATTAATKEAAAVVVEEEEEEGEGLEEEEHNGEMIHENRGKMVAKIDSAGSDAERKAIGKTGRSNRTEASSTSPFLVSEEEESLTVSGFEWFK